MSRREKTNVAAKRRPLIIPTEASTDQRGMAKHPIEHRGGSAPPQPKRAERHAGR